MKQNFKLALKRFGFVACIGLTTSVASTWVVAQSTADPNKVLRYVFPVAETGFDPAGVHDLYSAHVNGSIFETLFTYDYLASPAKLVLHGGSITRSKLRWFDLYHSLAKRNLFCS